MNLHQKALGEIGMDTSFHTMVQKFKKTPEVSPLAPIGGSSLFLRLRRKATAKSGKMDA